MNRRSSLQTNGLLLTFDKSRRMLLSNVDNTRGVLLHGRRASVTCFVARRLGDDARLYDGSIVDWTRRHLPAVMGK